jgi:pimeloyl-ACP methyl ester carboxylesterase
MSNDPHIKASDPLAYGRLGLSGFNLVVDLVESMHATIARRASPFHRIRDDRRTAGITRLVYQSVRALPYAMTRGIDAALPPLTRIADQQSSSAQRDAVVAYINGVVGDHLEATGNPLATPMTFRSRGKPLTLDRDAISQAIPAAKGKLLLLIHGLCMNDLQWNRRGHDHGVALGRELDLTELHLHYNTGRHISTNGAELADRIEQLVQQWPTTITELNIVAHSMGGLVSRSALHYGKQNKHQWPARLRKLVFLGTPHHGSPLERGGNRLDRALEISPYTAPFTALGGIRSAGITDLRYGYLVEGDWKVSRSNRKQRRRTRGGDNRRPMPLPTGIEYYALAASRAQGKNKLADAVVGDGLVPVASALGEHSNPALRLGIPDENKAIVYRQGHFDLLGAAVYKQVYQWLSS